MLNVYYPKENENKLFENRQITLKVTLKEFKKLLENVKIDG